MGQVVATRLLPAGILHPLLYTRDETTLSSSPPPSPHIVVPSFVYNDVYRALELVPWNRYVDRKQRFFQTFARSDDVANRILYDVLAWLVYRDDPDFAEVLAPRLSSRGSIETPAALGAHLLLWSDILDLAVFQARRSRLWTIQQASWSLRQTRAWLVRDVLMGRQYGIVIEDGGIDNDDDASDDDAAAFYIRRKYMACPIVRPMFVSDLADDVRRRPWMITTPGATTTTTTTTLSYSWDQMRHVLSASFQCDVPTWPRRIHLAPAPTLATESARSSHILAKNATATATPCKCRASGWVHDGHVVIRRRRLGDSDRILCWCQFHALVRAMFSDTATADDGKDDNEPLSPPPSWVQVGHPTDSAYMLGVCLCGDRDRVDSTPSQVGGRRRRKTVVDPRAWRVLWSRRDALDVLTHVTEHDDVTHHVFETCRLRRTCGFTEDEVRVGGEASTHEDDDDGVIHRLHIVYLQSESTSPSN